MKSYHTHKTIRWWSRRRPNALTPARVHPNPVRRSADFSTGTIFKSRSPCHTAHRHKTHTHRAATRNNKMEHEYDRKYQMDYNHNNEEEEDDEVAAAAADRVTATSYGALDTSPVTDAAWLIRLPLALGQLLETTREGVEIGELIFTKGGRNGVGTMVKPSLTIHIAESLVQPPERPPPVPGENAVTTTTTTTSSSQPPPHRNRTTGSTSTGSSTINPSTIPLHYSLQAMTKKIPVMHPFVRQSQTGSGQLLGTISRTANCQVADFKLDHQYRAQLKDRLVTTNILGQQRFVKPVDVTELLLTKQRPTNQTSSSTTRPNNNSFGAAVWQFGQHNQEYQEMASNAANSVPPTGPSAAKKARQFAPGQPLRSVLFELFEQESHWTIKELRNAAVAGGSDAAAAKRGEAEIRDILRSEIGEYHRSGDYKNKWELRQEFQQQQKKP